MNDGEVVVYRCCRQSTASSHGRVKGQKMNILPLLTCGEIKYVHPIQRKIAEQAINGILFKADIGTLHRGSMQISYQHQVSHLLSPGKSDHSSTHEYQY
jgi:hypothetical protein